MVAVWSSWANVWTSYHAMPFLAFLHAGDKPPRYDTWEMVEARAYVPVTIRLLCSVYPYYTVSSNIRFTTSPTTS